MLLKNKIYAIRRATSPKASSVAWLCLVMLVIATAGPFRAPSTETLAQNPPTQVDQSCLADARVVQQSRTGKVRFLGTEAGRPIRWPKGAEPIVSPEAAARAFMKTCGALFGISDQAAELSLTGVANVDSRAVARFQQISNGVPVIGGEYIIHLDNARNVLAAVARSASGAAVDSTPSVGPAAAVEAALEMMAKTYGSSIAFSASTPELWIYDPGLIGSGSGPARLVWRMQVTAGTLLHIQELVLVDARRGLVALHFNQVSAIRDRLTYDSGNLGTLPGTLSCDEANPCLSPPYHSHVTAAHLHAGDTYDFFSTNFGRDSLNNSGLQMKSNVRYFAGFENVFWSPALNMVVYGDALGYPLADDIAAHEFTHGLTQYTSKLFNYYQSGAISESLADVFGEFIDLTNGHGDDSSGVRWLIGEDVTGTGGGATRNMQNPPAFNHPDKMTSPLYDTSATEGFHKNSGVNNKAAFLMVDGGTFNGRTVTGIGITKTARIYYEVQTNLLTSGSDYGDLYEALFQACNNLIGISGISAANCTQVREATLAVEMNLEPVPGFNPEAPVCAGGVTPTHYFFDNLESGSSNFVLSGSPTNQWSYDSPYGAYAHSGAHFLFADDYPGTTTDTSAAMASSVAIPANAFLHFAHAFGFQGPDFDGGILEYSANAGSTWNDASSLFDANGYTGMIRTGNGNPLGGKSAFVGTSHGYISTRLNLSTLAGQSIRFRWRMGLDNGLYDSGWWLDDVRIYTCGGGGKKRAGQITSN